MQLYEKKWNEVAPLSRDLPVVIPIAALEQHGRHMPLFTDSLLLGEVIRRTSEQHAGRCLFTPLMWLGNSEHHLDFPGTMTAAPRLYFDLLRDMAENFLFHGFKRIVFVNGHGGNIVPSQQAVFELRQKYRSRNDLLLLTTTYWTLGGKPYEADPTMVQRKMGHACEWETSMMLRIRPDLVGDLSKVQAVDWGERFRAGLPRLDHERPDRTRPHRRPPHRHRRERRNPLPHLYRRRCQPAGASAPVGRQVVGRVTLKM